MKQKKILFALLVTTAFIGVIPLFHSIKSIPPSSAQTPRKFVTYTQPNFFSIQHPPDWVVDKTASNYIMFWSRQPSGHGGGKAPTDLIKTDITLMDGSLASAVKQQIAWSQENHSTVKRRRNLTIGGRNAVRLHLTGGGFDFPDTMLSLVRYNEKQTVAIASYYTASNARSASTIEQVHSSFRLQK